MKVLIIEDEKAAARQLSSLLCEISDKIYIETVIDNVKEAVEWFAVNAMPDIIFADIHLADGSAFDIFEKVDATCPIIFTTAYDEYAIKAFTVNSIAYLLKPISVNELNAAIKKLSFLNTDKNNDIKNLIEYIQKERSYTTHLLIPAGGSKLVPLAINSIELFFIEDSLLRVVTKDKKKYILPYTLEQIHNMVDPRKFFKLNRQFIITREAVADIDLWFGSRLSVNLKLEHKERIIISKTRVSEFKEWFTGR